MCDLAIKLLRLSAISVMLRMLEKLIIAYPQKSRNEFNHYGFRIKRELC